MNVFDWIHNLGYHWIPGKENCWANCGRKSGKCSFCDIDGLNGYCCKRDYLDNGDCPSAAILNSPTSHHRCVHGKGEHHQKPLNKITWRHCQDISRDLYGFRNKLLLLLENFFNDGFQKFPISRLGMEISKLQVWWIKLAT